MGFVPAATLGEDGDVGAEGGAGAPPAFTVGCWPARYVTGAENAPLPSPRELGGRNHFGSLVAHMNLLMARIFGL